MGLNGTYYGEDFLFKEKACKMRFFYNHICTSDKILEVIITENDKKNLSKDENEKFYKALQLHKSCSKKIQTLKFLAQHFASGYRYVEVCLPYSLVYKQEATSEYASFPCSCNSIAFDNIELNFCSLIIAV